MKSQDTEIHATVGIWPGDIGSLAFTLDEFFDVLDVVYLKGDDIHPTMSRNSRLQGLRRPNGV